MNDINTRADIEFLIDTFYKKILTDDLIGHFFTRVVKLDFEKHLPIMCDFWESTLLGAAKYKGNPMLKHQALNEKEAIKPIHFERWLVLWKNTINSHYSGARAQEAMKRAKQIAELMQLKINDTHKKYR